MEKPKINCIEIGTERQFFSSSVMSPRNNNFESYYDESNGNISISQSEKEMAQNVLEINIKKDKQILKKQKIQKKMKQLKVG